MGKKYIEKYKEHGKLYQDQLYGTKVLTPLAIAIIDSAEFQRLAGLKELGFTNLVYRGAQHTRFCHSIGAYFLTRTIMRRISQNHERLGLGHPGEDLPDCYSTFPYNAYPDKTDIKKVQISNQSKWRGMTEVVSTAALIHDISHAPFGHTLEDEFSGISKRHDTLAGPRLYELLFNENSTLKKVFLSKRNQWIKGPKGGIKDDELARLIYIILSWKEDIPTLSDFPSMLKKEKEKEEVSPIKDQSKLKIINELEKFYDKFAKARPQMFHPYMSDIVGNTICADLLDYLPRDRMNLGMEYRIHGRLQRYLTIREGSLYKGEGKRISIMVTRPGRGGQRRDVATAVLDIMRERYEMVERVYYHHKKAAVSTMLAKLAELCPTDKMPNDKNKVYPAPWTVDDLQAGVEKNPLHFSDTSLIDYLGTVKVAKENTELQRKLYVGIRFDRKAIYRTLLVVDTDLVQMSARPISYFSKDLRKDEQNNPSNKGRLKLEGELIKATGADAGEVLVYCPSPDMQSKEVDARLEIKEKRVLPLSVQRESFAYNTDVRVIEQYYQQLWRIYIFVSPRLYEDPIACQAVVDKFCEIYDIEKMIAYDKVRRYDFKISHDVIATRAIRPIRKFFGPERDDGIVFHDVPATIVATVCGEAAKDKEYLTGIKTSPDSASNISRLASLLVLCPCNKVR